MFSAIGLMDGGALTYLSGFGNLVLPLPAIPTFPKLRGLGWPMKRSPVQSTLKQPAVSGSETRLQLFTYGVYRYELTFDYLGSGAQNQDWQLLTSFFQLVGGAADPFHFDDIYDNAVANQALGTGDGSTATFNFMRMLSAITEPCQDVTQSSVIVRVAGVVQDASRYTFLTDPNWGFAYGLEFDASYIPGAGAAVTADFSYMWPCRFDDDTAEFSSIMSNFWELKKLSFTTMKVV